MQSCVACAAPKCFVLTLWECVQTVLFALPTHRLALSRSVRGSSRPRSRAGAVGVLLAGVLRRVFSAVVLALTG